VAETDSGEARALVEQRQRAREARDYRLADELRDRIAALGFEVLDTPDGPELVPAAAPPAEISLLVDLEGWPEDAARFLASLDRHRGARNVEVIPANHGPDLGFGAAQNRALAQAGGNLVVLVDTSLELTGDLLGALVGVLDDPTVAVAGPFGLATSDLRDYEERTTGDVAAVQGYCLAARRTDLVSAGGVRESFAFYRNADIDLSLRLRTLHDPIRRAVSAGAEHCRRHVHRAWEATPEAERADLSRRNMRRIHKRFGGRTDLIVP
jgi:GT2 family glycosyltransferase